MVDNCCKQKSSLVKCLIILLTALIIVLIALFINLVIRKDDNGCNSAHCIKASAEIIRYIDQSVDPCNDFHAYACGNYIRNVKELPPPEPLDEMNAMIMDRIKMNDTRPFVTQKLFFQACSNLGAIDMNQDETILEMFQSLGDWPVLRGSNWNGTLFDWTEVAKNSRKLGMKFDWFLDFSIVEDVNQTRMNILKIDIPRSTRRINDEEKHLRKKLLTDIAEILGAPKYLAHYETAKTIEFEDELAAVVENHKEREREGDLKLNEKLRINELQLLWPNIQWLDLINAVTGNRMSSSDIIIFSILDYIRDLSRLILGTPKRIVADYMMWKIVEEFWQFFSQPVREKFEKYNEQVYDQQPELDRQKFCLNESKKQFPLVAESVYVRQHVTQQKRQLVREMLYIIQRHYIKLLENASWMRRDERHRALNRIQDIKFLIGGPEEIFDQFRFAENLGLYAFGFKSSTNVIDMLNERRDRYYEKYFSVLNRGIMNNTLEFYEKIINITDFSFIDQNTIVIPASLLRDSFFSPSRPNYLNYGTLGKALAYEIFDYIFQLKNTSSIENEDDNPDQWPNSNVFEQSIRCLIKESSYFHNFELKKPSKMRENLGEFIASDVAYDSYNMWLQMLPQEAPLPAVKFTPHQLFWIQSSKFLCSKIYSKHHRDISRFKIIGPLRNSDNFAHDFNCPIGSKMNPKKKCRIL